MSAHRFWMIPGVRDLTAALRAAADTGAPRLRIEASEFGWRVIPMEELRGRRRRSTHWEAFLYVRIDDTDDFVARGAVQCARESISRLRSGNVEGWPT